MTLFVDDVSDSADKGGVYRHKEVAYLCEKVVFDLYVEQNTFRDNNAVFVNQLYLNGVIIGWVFHGAAAARASALSVYKPLYFGSFGQIGNIRCEDAFFFVADGGFHFVIFYPDRIGAA